LCREAVALDGTGRPSRKSKKDPVCGFWEPLSPDVLARVQNIRPLERAEDLIAPIWESDEELEQFLADVYAARRAARAHNS
jgi:hypothetical protein